MGQDEGGPVMLRFEQGGWWLPDGEEHLQQWMLKVNHKENGLDGETRLTYQYHKYQAAMKHTARRGRAIDVGAHVGLWSWVMARDFLDVVCFEPVTVHQECWEANMKSAKNATLHRVALGATSSVARVRNRTPGSSGDTGIDPVAERSSLRASIQDEGEEVQVRTLDEFNIPNVDFIKIDCEGYELYVLQGAVDTIKRCRPCIIVEQKPETGMKDRYGLEPADCLNFLGRLGMRVRAGIQGDYILNFG